MKIAAGRVDQFIAKPDPAARAILVYGPDRGLVRERIKALTAAVVENPSDGFRIADLDGAALKDDPARLADEAAAIALTGGRRVVRCRDIPDSQAKLFEEFLANPAGDALVLVDGGELGPSSKLRRLFEGAGNAAALPCYADDARTLPAVVRQTLAEHGVTVQPDALAYLVDHLGGDRAMTRSELEKLALFVGDGGVVTLEDAREAVGDSTAIALDDITVSLMSGDVGRLDRSLSRAFHEGIAPVAVLRAASQHAQRLYFVRASVERGDSIDAAMKRLRPPVFFKTAPAFKQAVSRWRESALVEVLRRLLDAEAMTKQTGMPATTITAHTLLDIARLAARPNGNRRR